MKQLLHKKMHSLISFLCLILLLNDGLYANINPPTPSCPIVTERFQGLGDGATVNNSSTGWSLDASHVAGTGYFAVKSNRFHAQELGGEGIWYSKVFSVAGYTDFQVAAKVSSEGDMNSSEYVKIYYRVNGGAETLLDSRTGNFGTIDFISPMLNGNNVQIIIKLYNYNNGGSQTSKYYIEEYRVFKEHGACANTIPVTITPSGTVLTCTNSSVTLAAATTATGSTTWSWTGPGGYTSTAQNPSVTVAGTYTVVGTNAAGSASATITVTENKTAPAVTTTGGALACSSNVIISATSSIAGSAFSWIGPGSFTSTQQNPSVNTAGTYTVTVTNPSNGCTTTKTATVTAGSVTTSTIWLQEFTYPNGTVSGSTPNAWTSSTPAGSFSVQSNEFYVSNVGTGSAEAVWTSESFSITGKSNVSISVSARSGVASSGDALESSGSSLDYLRMYYKLNGGAEVLFREYLGAINSNSTTFSIGSIGSLSGSSLQIIIRGRTTAADERYYFDNIVVTGTSGAPGITASVSGTVTCTTTAQLSATVSSGTVSGYAWTGPNGFTSTIQNPVISAGGQYTVTATLPNGCTIAAPITITENKTLPDISASGGALVCNPNVTLNANSAVSGAVYSWTGPGSYSSNSKNPVVTAPGSYIVTVTNPANGCTASQTVTVTSGLAGLVSFWQEDFTFADGTTVDNATVSKWSASTSGSGIYSIAANEFKTSFSSDAEGVWTSESINISGNTDINLSVYLRSEATVNNAFETGDYIRIYYKLNGGAEILLFEETASIGSGTTGTASVTPSLSLPNGNTIQLVIRTRNSDVSERYYFDNINITGSSIAVPANVEITSSTNSNEINCLVAGMTLTASSSTPGVTYSWTLPGGATISATAIGALATGNYILTATNPATGCTAKDTFVVVTNYSTPMDGQITPSSAALTCTNSSVTLTGSNSLAGVTFTWATGTGVVLGTGPVFTVSQPGYYNLIMKHPVTGCNHTIGAQVIAVSDPPLNVTVGTSSANSEINCTAGSVTLDGSSTTSGTTYTWTGPGGYASSGASVIISTPGEYIMTATNPASGCTTSVSKTVASNTAQPTNISATAVTNGGQLTCTFSSINLTGSSSTTGANYSWSGPSGFAASGTNATVIAPGEYILTVTDPVNGCSASSSANVTQNIIQPTGVSATHTDILTCLTTSTDLSGFSSTPGATFLWTGPGGFTATTRNAIAVAPGTYFFKVTNPANGCARTVSTVVEQDIAAPGDVAAGNDGPLTCTMNEVTLTGSTSALDVDYVWTGPDGNFISFAPVVSVTSPGTYTLTITDLVTNGCSASVTTIVTQDLTGCTGKMTINPVKEPVTGVKAELPATELEHKVFPNPVRDQAVIEFRPAGNDYVTVKIINSNASSGKMIFNSRVIANHTYKLVWNAENHSAGIYYCIITINGKIYSNKLLLIR